MKPSVSSKYLPLAEASMLNMKNYTNIILKTY